MPAGGRAAGRAFARATGPEGLLLGALLALGTFTPAAHRAAPLVELVAAATAVAGVIIGWRFGRGRVVFGLAVLTATAAVPLVGPGTADSLLAILVPANLALIGLLPDRGVATRAGLAWGGALAVQAAGVLLLMGTGTGPGGDPLARVHLPGLATTMDSATVAWTVALTALAVRTLAGGGAPVRGLLWGTAAALAAFLGHPAGPVYLLTTGALVLVVAALEDAHSLAYRDALTGLPSRRALDELLDRTARRYTIAMIDVDHFKRFNDRHGHDVGDQVLRMVATRLREVGGGARAFRYGGEEFTLVFRGRNLAEARPFLEEARANVEAATFVVRSPHRPKKKPRRKSILRFRGPRKELSVTVSVGAAERSARSRSPTEMIQAADAALYRAKRQGRNRVVA